MCLVREFLVIGFGFRFSITVEVCFDHRAWHNAIFAAGDQEQWRARVVMKSDGLGASGLRFATATCRKIRFGAGTT